MVCIWKGSEGGKGKGKLFNYSTISKEVIKNKKLKLYQQARKENMALGTVNTCHLTVLTKQEV